MLYVRAYGPRVPATCVSCVPEIHGSMPPGPHALYVHRTHAHQPRACRAYPCTVAPQAPRDEDCYIRPPLRPPATIAMSRRLSQERRFLRKLEASLDRSSDPRKQMMYDTLRQRHKQAMQRIIDDVVKLGGSRNACAIF